MDLKILRNGHLDAGQKLTKFLRAMARSHLGFRRGSIGSGRSEIREVAAHGTAPSPRGRRTARRRSVGRLRRLRRSPMSFNRSPLIPHIRVPLLFACSKLFKSTFEAVSREYQSERASGTNPLWSA